MRNQTPTTEALPAGCDAYERQFQAGADLMARLLAQPFGVLAIAGEPVYPAREPTSSLADRVREIERRLDDLQADKTLLRVEHPLPVEEPVLIGLLRRIADAIAPEPEAVVGSPYVAGKLGCTTTWVSEMVRSGEVPKGCVVPGTGNGKPWKFYRDKVDAWIASR